MIYFYKIRSEIERYKAKPLDHEIYVMVTYKQCKGMDSARLNQFPKYDAFVFDTIGDTRHNH